MTKRLKTSSSGKRAARDNLRPGNPRRHPTGMQTTSSSKTQTWPDLAIGLYDKLTGRGAEITYEFEGLDISIPSSSDPAAAHANWKVSGIVKIRTKDAQTTSRP